MNETAPTRFWAKVDKAGPVPAHRPDLGPCWIWTGAKVGKGYGKFEADPRPASRRQVRAHIFAYELLIGPVPDWADDLHHLCEIEACANPWHVEPMTRRDHLLLGNSFSALNARKAHCPAGHPYDEANTYCHRGKRSCKKCNRAEQRERRSRVTLTL